jgi:hypothetical protein
MPCFPYLSVYQELPVRRQAQKALAQCLRFLLAN